MSWYNPVSWFVDKEALAAAEEADRKNASISQDYLARGLMTQDEYNQAYRHYSDDAITAREAERQVSGAFGEGLADGARAELDLVTQAIPNAVNTTLNETLKAIFRAVPWWVWIAGLIGGYIWLFGLPKGFPKFARR